MTDTSLTVVMVGETVGSVRQSAGQLTFSYAGEYRSDPEATPLSISMPLVSADHEDRVIRSFLWGLLPDNEQVLQRWGRRFEVSPRNPLAILSFVGEDCAGAAEFLRPERIGEHPRPGLVEPLTVGDVAEALRGLARDPTAWHGPLDTGAFSLAGAQPKLALYRDEDGNWGQPRGSTPTTHILKPATGAIQGLELNEHLCLTTARNLGLLAVSSQVMTFEDQRAIVLERYDRLRRQEGVVRVHQEDLCQAFALHPDQKYQAQGGPTPAQVVNLFRDLQSQEQSEVSTWRFLDALAFNWIIGGTDAHAKNYSILLSGDQIRLAPLYDVASILPYGGDPHRLTFAMKIGSTCKMSDVSRLDWLRVADDLDLEHDEVLSRVTELAASLPAAFEAAGALPAIVALESDMPTSLGTMISERAALCDRMLG